jgi:hypothetical protein
MDSFSPLEKNTQMQKLLKSFFGQNHRSGSRSSQARKRTSGQSAQITRSSGAEVLEQRTLLAAQLIASDATMRTISAGDTFDVPVIYQTLDDAGDPAALQSNLISFNLHFDADALTYDSSKEFFAEGIQVVPNTTRPESDAGVADDNDADTETALVASYSDSDFALALGWPNAPSAAGQQLYIATFTAKAGFSGTTINFSANATGNVTGQAAQFEFQSTSLDLNAPPVVLPPVVSISNATAVEEGGNSVFNVTLDKAAAGPVTVDFSTADGTATSGADYTAQTNGTVMFAAGEISKNVSIVTLDDIDDEPGADEDFTVSLSNPTGVTIGTAVGTGTIGDNDDPLTVSIGDAQGVTEGGTSEFTVSLSRVASGSVTVDYSTADGTATSGADYTGQASQMLTFAAGETQKTINIVTLDDTDEEPGAAEDFTVSLSNPAGAAITTGTATGTINDNEGAGFIHGRKYNDLNSNGTRESGEPWLNGWTIELVNAAGAVVDSQVTADMDLNNDQQIDPATESGWYWFTAIPGSYRLQEVQQAGWRQTAPASQLPAVAYQLDTQLMFRETSNSFENWGGRNEKWILADGNEWYFITPSGTLYEWDGSGRDNLTGTPVETLSPEYHADLALLYDAAPAQFITYTVVGGQTLPDVNFGNVSLATPGSVHGRKWNDLNGDGQRSSDEPWLNGWDIELVDAAGNVVQTATTMDMDLNNDNQIDPATESGWYWLTDVTAGEWSVREVAQPGWQQTAPLDTVELDAYELDSSQNLHFSRSLFPNWGGLNERWMLGDDAWYYITPNGDVFEWNGSPRHNLSGELVAQLSPEYHADPSLLYNARNPFEVEIVIEPGQTLTDLDFGNHRESPDPTDFAGAGNVAARIAGNNLILTGDNAANGVMVSTNQEGWVVVTGLGDTTIAGQDQPWVIAGWTGIPGDLRVNLYGGGDAIVLRGLQVGDDVTVNTHGGNDFLLVDDVTAAGNLDFRSTSGDNSVFVRDTQVGDLARSITGNGNDALLTDNLTVGGRTIVSARGGNDVFGSTYSMFAGDVSLNAGGGNDQVLIHGNAFGAGVILDGSSGTDALDIDDATTSSRTPVIRRFEQDSVDDADGVLDGIMQRLADVGLDNLLD